jgi:hypothetical protein
MFQRNLMPPALICYTLKMEAACPFETLLSVFQNIWHHIPSLIAMRISNLRAISKYDRGSIPRDG